jgi:KaiC/GvpD/RAD55 family RecA-like ATPase
MIAMIDAQKLERELAGLAGGRAFLVISNSEDNAKINAQILKLLTGRGFGIYITANQPYASLVEMLTENGVDIKNLFFVDCITKRVKESPEEDENCIYIDSPKNLTDISISITEALEAAEGEKFLFMDSLSTLLIYNPADVLARFSHFLISKIKLLKVAGVFMSAERDMEKGVLRQISQFCDKTIRL